MKKNIPKTIILVFIIHVGGNIGLIILLLNGNATDFLSYSYHIISAVFMLLSLCFFHNRWTYIINAILLIPMFYMEILGAGFMCFLAPPIGIILFIGFILVNSIFFSKGVRGYFGFNIEQSE
jgi:hypothetical protein